MKRLKIKPDPTKNYHWKYADDISRIVKAFASQGYEISNSDAILAWERYSDTYAAGWLILPSPEYETEIYYILKDYFEEIVSE